MVTLSISHNLFLTKEERYAWYNGENLEIVGVSVPTWFQKGLTSEPAVEVFCKYKLTTSIEGIIIKHYGEGYQVAVPKDPSPRSELSPEIWDSLPEEEQTKWTERNEPNPSIQNLLEVRDGGSRWLAFRQYSKIKRNKKTLNLIHFMEINVIEDLEVTLS